MNWDICAIKKFQYSEKYPESFKKFIQISEEKKLGPVNYMYVLYEVIQLNSIFVLALGIKYF